MTILTDAGRLTNDPQPATILFDPFDRLMSGKRDPLDHSVGSDVLLQGEGAGLAKSHSHNLSQALV